ncbi:hypothetical protein BD410DRAFT_169686 [Rickenella mellea]|uniref:HTH CENPB-type domain-containing protein n=1 Tax=Rickenella mellea TaxID=50990 RepID=A0A4Y7Q6D9_9AGAM|nr:hypothetical protein BD410DRAFT_169686 [Rickenella mellea]
MADGQQQSYAPSPPPPPFAGSPPQSRYDMALNADESSRPHTQEFTSHNSPPSQMYASMNNSSESLEFSQHAQNSFTPRPHFSDGNQPPLSPAILPDDMSTNLSSQISGNTGPSRVSTRRQARAAQIHASPYDSHGAINRHSIHTLQAEQSVSMTRPFYVPSPASRPQTPQRITQTRRRYSEQISLGTSPYPTFSSASAASPLHASPPASTSSTISPYGFHPYSTHSRSTSSSTDPRSNSPAMSVLSVVTSLSSCSSVPFPPTPVNDHMLPLEVRRKQKKQRLYNVDRKAICIYAQQNPHARQEDIALQWGVERSTISKILKFKGKWINCPPEEELKAAKHRPSKFPEIEAHMLPWLAECKRNGALITDAMIKAKSKEIGKDIGIGPNQFKGSSGWIENFKHRHGIRKGVWTGVGRNGESMLPPDELSDDQLSPEDETDTTDAVPHPRTIELQNALRETPAASRQTMDMELDDRGLSSSAQGHGLDPSPVPRCQWVEDQPLQYQHEEYHADRLHDAAIDQTTVLQQTSISNDHREIVDLSRDDAEEQVDEAVPLHQGSHPTTPLESVDPFRLQQVETKPFVVEAVETMHAQDAMQYESHHTFQPISSHDTHDLHDVQTYDNDSGIVTAQDANHAMNKVLDYVNSRPGDYVSSNEKDVLVQVQQLLWLSAQGLPDSRTVRT